MRILSRGSNGTGSTAASSVAVPYAALNTRFFSKNYQAGFELATLLDAALNADLAIVEKILIEVSTANRQIFLSTVGVATITHLNIERTGTPLQMALYGHDEEMVALIKHHMDPAEFQRQWEEIFGPDYMAFLEKQLCDATQLCSKLDSAFEVASAADITNALNRVANTTSVLQDILNRFKDNMERYVRENRVHNPYILQCLFVIYNNFYSYIDKNRLLSQQAIGVAHKLSSSRWLQHLSQGICYLAEKEEVARRSFSLRNSQPVIDIRSLDRLGVDFSIGVCGEGVETVNNSAGPWWMIGIRTLQNLCQTKTTNFMNIMPQMQSGRKLLIIV